MTHWRTARSVVGGFDQPSGPHTAHDTPRDSIPSAEDFLGAEDLAALYAVAFVCPFILIGFGLVIWGLFFS